MGEGAVLAEPVHGSGAHPENLSHLPHSEQSRRSARDCLHRSQTLDHGRVYWVDEVSYRDMDASPLGFDKGVTPFLDLPAELPIPQRLPGIPAARLATGGSIVNGAAYDEIDADMVDMETYAVFRAASLCGTAMIGLRGISDGHEPIRRFSDWTFYLAEIDAQLAGIVRALPDAFAALPKAYWTAR